MSTKFDFKIIWRSLLLLWLLVVFAEPALAHRLNVFARVVDGNIEVQGNFGKNRPARNSEIEIFNNATGEKINTARTDEQGRCIFPIPENAAKTGITIQLNAGQGHMNKWVMDASQFNPEVKKTETGNSAPAIPSVKQDEAFSENRLRQIIREELAAYQKDEPSFKEPGLTEIIGGIGWIVGIAGLWLWFKNYRKKQRDSSG